MEATGEETEHEQDVGAVAEGLAKRLAERLLLHHPHAHVHRRRRDHERKRQHQQYQYGKHQQRLMPADRPEQPNREHPYYKDFKARLAKFREAEGEKKEDR